MPESAFVTALRRRNLKEVCAVDKSDYHNHACLGYRLDKLRQFTNVPILDPPARFDTFEAFIDYLVDQLHPHIYTRAGFEFSVDAALKQAIEDGVTLLEISIDAQMMGVYDSVEELTQALQRIDADNPEVTFGPEIGINRQWGDDVLQKWVVPMIESGFFVSIDLYGDELSGEPEQFRDIYRFAGDEGLIRKAHAGEYRDAAFVRHSVEVLELDEVQHGIAAAESPEVMDWLRKRGTTLHICPTSNVCLGRVDSLNTHPMRILFDNGVQFTINSDDIMVFGSSVSEEYISLCEVGLFTEGELDGIRQFGLGLRNKKRRPHK